MTTKRSAAFVDRVDGLRHPSPAHAQAFLGLVRAGRMLDQALDAELRAEHGLGLRAFEVLLHLAVFSPAGELGMAELNHQAPLSQSRVSRLVAELESRGLVARSPDESDQRAVSIAITDLGRQRLREVQDTHYAGLERWLFAPLTDDEITRLGDLTGRILRAIDENP